MTQRELLYSLLLIFGVLISTVSQVLLKKSASKEHKGIIREYLNPYVIGAYSLFVIATFITIYAFKGIPLSYGPILEGTGYFFITIFVLYTVIIIETRVLNWIIQKRQWKTS